MRFRAVVPLIVAVLVLAACGELGSLSSLAPTGGDSGSRTSGLATATPTEEATAGEIFACDLISLADVQSISPFTTPFAEAEPEVTACRYGATVDPPPPRQPGVLLKVFDYVTPEAALAGVRAERDNLNYDHPGAATPLAGLGVEAYQYGELPIKEDRIVVAAASGRYFASAELVGEYNDARGPDIGYAAKVAAGAELLRLVFSRLP